MLLKIYTYEFGGLPASFELDLGQEVVNVTTKMVIVDLGDCDTLTHEQVQALDNDKNVLTWKLAATTFADPVQRAELLEQVRATFARSKNVVINA